MSLKKEKNKTFDMLYSLYKKDLIRYAFSLTKDATKAEDLLQDTFAIAWVKLDTIKDINKAKYWLITTMRREFLKDIKGDKFKNTIDFEDMLEILKSSENTDKTIELNEVLNNLEKINFKYSEVLVLHSVMGYKISEIALKLKLPENTISTRLARSRTKILETLKQKNT